MLTGIEVRDFQSLARADIPLGRLTVITGPTSSGKSALFRALRALARNDRTARDIRSGQATSSVTAGGTDWLVRLSRSAGRRGPNEYRTATWTASGWAGTRYTKLGGTVPAAVTSLLRLSDLNFARQGDAPYLLDVSGAEVARRLGELTNVSLVLGAAAEAGRLRKQAERDLDAARARRAALLAEVQQYAGLGERRKAVTAAEGALALAQEAHAAALRLRALVHRLEAAEAALAGSRAEAASREPPSLAQLDAAVARAARLRELVGGLQAAERDRAGHAAAAEEAERDGRQAEEAVHAAMAAIGHCPWCGQAVS